MVIAICGRDDDTGVCFTLAAKGKDCYNHLVEERHRTDLSVGRRKPEEIRKVPKREKFAKRGYDFEDHMCG